jgi:hypothetical protein
MKLVLPFILLILALPLIAQQKKSHWLKPDHAVVQFAGSMGMYSAGIGYASRNNKVYLDFLMGHVPKEYSYNQLGIATVKFTKTIWQSNVLKNQCTFTPLTGGVFITYTFGKNFNWPDHYPDGYYWWSESLRPNIFLGGMIARSFEADKTLKRLTFFYEVGTNDLKLTSYYLNPKTVSPFQILHGGLGLRLSF